MLEIIGIYVIVVLFFVALATKMISYLTIRKMEKSASAIQKSNHKLMKLIKAKFEHASLVSDKVQNIHAFVEKHLYEYKVLGIKLNALRSVPQKIGWIILLIGSACTFGCYREDMWGTRTLLYIEWTGIFVLTIILLYYLLDEEIHMGAVRNYVVEYLENVCVHRFEKSAKINRAVDREVKEEVPNEEPEERKPSEQEIRIRAILEEFLA